LVRENEELRKKVAQLAQENRRAVADKQQLAREQVSALFMERLLQQNNRLMIGQGCAPRATPRLPSGPYSIADTARACKSVAGSSQEEGGRSVSGSGQKEGGRSDEIEAQTNIS